MKQQFLTILDTDIGSDVDDALALAQIIGTPEIDLIGVTTVYGDTQLRAKIAGKIAELAGSLLAIYPGEGKPLSKRQVWWAGHEGALYTDLDRISVAEADATEFLVDQVLSNPGKINIIAIGPLTNIAKAIISEPGFAEGIGHLWIMGGDFSSQDAEHNFLSDLAATKKVFSANISATVVGVEMTRQVRLGEDVRNSFAKTAKLGALLAAEMEQWWNFWETNWNVPHDSLAVLMMVAPELFEFSAPGRVLVRDDGSSTFLPGAGKVRLVQNLAAEAATSVICSAIIAACSAS